MYKTNISRKTTRDAFSNKKKLFKSVHPFSSYSVVKIGNIPFFGIIIFSAQMGSLRSPVLFHND